MKRLVKLFPIVTLMAFLASCDGKPFEQEDFLHYLFPNPWDALAIFLAFLVLLLVVFYFAYKPVKKLIRQRKDYVEGKIKSAEEREAIANQKVEEAEGRMRDGVRRHEQYRRVLRPHRLCEQSRLFHVAFVAWAVRRSAAGLFGCRREGAPL